MSGEQRSVQYKALAARLDALQKLVSEAEGRPVSDSEFARRYLPFSSSTLSRIRNPDDPYTGSIDNITDKVQQAEDEIASRIDAVRINAQSEQAFVQTTLARAIQASVKKARSNKLRKVVVALVKSGGGKSAIGQMLAAKGNIYVEGRQSWRKSYKSFCAAIARAAGRPVKSKKYTEQDAEDRMLQALSAHDDVLYIDEANTLSAECVNALKLIVNQTNTVIVIAAIPAMWDKLTSGAEEEVAQLVNRCQPILRDRGVSAEDVTPFMLRAGLSQHELDKSIGSIVESANEFGAYKTVVALVEELKTTDKPTAEDVTAYLKFHRKNIALAGLNKGGK